MSIKANLFKFWKSETRLSKEKHQKLDTLERNYKLRKFLSKWTNTKQEIVKFKQSEQKAMVFKCLARQRAVFKRLKRLREANRKRLRAKIKIESNRKDQQLGKYFKLWHTLTNLQLEEKARVQLNPSLLV